MKGPRILLLEVTSASASGKETNCLISPRDLVADMLWNSLGANLTVANHAFFVSPLLTPSKETYTAYESQAIGRVRR
jgi:hypothetical protein